MENTKNSGLNQKKAYSKPAVTEVKLSPSEVVLGCLLQLGVPGCTTPGSI